MKLHILTPSQNVIQTTVDEVIAYGPKGEFEILPNHADYVTPINLGALSYSQNGETHRLLVDGGYLEVAGEEIKVMAEAVELAKNLSLEETKKRLAELNQELAQKTIEPERFAELTAERDREQVRMAVVS